MDYAELRLECLKLACKEGLEGDAAIQRADLYIQFINEHLPAKPSEAGGVAELRSGPTGV